MEIYKYHRITGVYLSSSLARLDPRETKRQGYDVFLIPANATNKPPPDTEENETAVFIDGEWVVIPDFTKETYYDPVTQEEITVALGEDPPVDYPKTKPPIELYNPVWENNEWVEGLSSLEIINIKRRNEYPGIDELVVALWEKEVENRPEAINALQKQRKAVKKKYPKK